MNLPIRKTDTEVIRGHIFYLVSFIEDENFNFRKNSGSRNYLFYGQVSKEEMVIDDDQVRVTSNFFGSFKKAVFPIGAFFANTRFRCGAERRP